MPPMPPPAPLSPAGAPLATFADRLLAHLIDTMLVGAVGLVLATPFLVLLVRRLSVPDPYEQTGAGAAFADFALPVLLFQAGFFVAMALLYYLYLVEYMHRRGQTLGKRAMGIRIVPVDPGRALTRGMAAKRYAVTYLGGVFIPMFTVLDGLWPLWDKPYQQSLHDKTAGTVVVKVSP